MSTTGFVTKSNPTKCQVSYSGPVKQREPTLVNKVEREQSQFEKSLISVLPGLSRPQYTPIFVGIRIFLRDVDIGRDCFERLTTAQFVILRFSVRLGHTDHSTSIHYLSE